MAPAELDTQSYWEDSSSVSRYPALDRDLTVDVVVIGAGITGLTAAYLLKRSGQHVAVIDRRRCGGVDSGLTTAHVTCVTDLDLSELVKNFGRDHAQAVWDAGLAAIEQIDRIVDTEDIDCEWTWVPGYKHAPPGGTRDERAGAPGGGAARRRAGVRRALSRRRAVRRHPGSRVSRVRRSFIRASTSSALAKLIDGDGSHVFEHTESEEIERRDPLSVKAGGHTITCGYLVIATHTPLMGKTNLASALGAADEALPLHLVRARRPAAQGHGAGGAASGTRRIRITTCGSIRIAASTTRSSADRITRPARRPTPPRATRRSKRRRGRVLPGFEITHRWSGQVVETNDGLPFIGETSSKQFAATGYAGNGMTFGTLAGMMAHDCATGRKNPWSDLFDPGRTKVRGGAWDYIKENIDYPYYMIRDRFAGPEGKSLRGVQARRRADPRAGRARRSPRTATSADRRRCCRRCARTWAAWSRWNEAEQHVGLPVPRLAVHADRRGAGRAGGDAARARS